MAKNARSHGRICRLALLCVLFVVAVSGAVSKQPQQSASPKLAYGVDRANVPDAIAKLKSGNFFAIHVDLIVRADAVEAVPALKEQFERVQALALKAKIAAGLVRLGADKDGTYWNFLVNYAKPALESDSPDFVIYDSQGKSPAPNPEFDAWVHAHNLGPNELSDLIQFFPSRILLLAWSRDPRAVPLLHHALSLPNHMFQVAAAMGLAEIGDSNAIPWIIDACKNAPPEAAEAMAQSLVYFDDNSAQSAVDQFIPKEKAKIYREATRVNGQRVTPLTAPLYD